jgi:acyl-CoA reductase-like NAD-dependent aldehyde dehydrogenase
MSSKRVGRDSSAETLEKPVSMPMEWKRTAAAVHWNVQPFINGRYQPAICSDAFDHINPATECTLYTAGVGAPADIADAVRVARCRFDEGCWSELPPVKRAEILMRLADLIVRDRVNIALLDSLEMGKPIRDALYDAEHFAPMLLRSWAGFADKLLGVSAPLTAGTLAFNCYEPRGVVGAITPWNFPVVNAVYKIGPALAAGNTLVLKPSELAPSSALRLAELALEAGIPEGVFNVVPGLGSTAGAALALHPGVNLLSFTGSTATGRKLMELSGRSNGKPLLLECGGKSPQLVFDDVEDLEAVASATVRSALYNQGQVCSAHTRLVVHDKIKERLLEAIIKQASAYQPGDPLCERTTFGPLASPAQRERVKRYIAEGIEAGAVLVLKGTIQENGGCYVSPTVFDQVSPTMSIVRDEIFGPVLCVQGFKSEEEAVALANNTDFGLAATVWTRDIGRGRRVAHAVKAGYVTVRTSGPEDFGSGCVLGHEPQKASGFGSEAGLRGLESYSTLKAIHFVGG